MTAHVATASGTVPAHIPAELVFEFDIYDDPRIGEDVQGTYAAALADAPPIFWTPLNGGHWIAKSFDAITAVVTDPEHFSVREMQIPRVENPPFFIPLSLDPPENLPYRRAMMPMFGPVAIKAIEPRIREWAQKLVGEVADRGRCDFQGDVSKVFPVSVFMELMGMDLARLREFRELAEAFFDNQNNAEEMGRLSGLILGEMKALIDEKRAHPDDKLMSHFITVDIGGRTMSEDEILAMSFVLFLGGMDTVTNVTGFAYQQLAQMPDVQARLATDPSLIPAFVDEAIRLYGVVNTPRLVVQEQTIGAATLRPGEMVLCVLCLGSRDPAKFAAPNAFDIERKRTAHLTFSSGPHLCIGHVLGRAELRILTEEWMKRIPSFRAVAGEKHAFRTGTVMALENLPLEMGARMSRHDGADAPYWQGLEQGRLMLPRCDGCERWIWPAGHRCGECGTVGVHWVERPMRASVFSWTRTWHRFGGTESLDLPFTTVLAEVEDCGIRLLGLLDDPDRVDPVLGEKLVGRPGETAVGDDRIPTIIWSRRT